MTLPRAPAPRPPSLSASPPCVLTQPRTPGPHATKRPSYSILHPLPRPHGPAPADAMAPRADARPRRGRDLGADRRADGQPGRHRAGDGARARARSRAGEETERERESVCVCVCVRARACMFERESEGVLRLPSPQIEALNACRACLPLWRAPPRQPRPAPTLPLNLPLATPGRHQAQRLRFRRRPV